MSAELAVLGAGQGDVTRFAGQVVTGIGFVCAGFIFIERTSLRGVSTAVSLFNVRRDWNHLGLWISDRSNPRSCHHTRLPPSWTQSTFGGSR